jgi:hypothetical protein
VGVAQFTSIAVKLYIVLALRTKNWLPLAVLLIGTLAVFAALDWYQHRFVRCATDLWTLIRGGDATVFDARVELVRRAGMLDIVRGTTGHADPDYTRFVHETEFDYWKDLDAVAGSVSNGVTLLVVKGRFNWDRIRSYVQRQGGECEGNGCQLRGSGSGKWISTVRIQRNVLGIALGSSKSLSNEIHPGQRAITGELPAHSVWVRLAPSLVKDPFSVPVALRIFLISLQPAQSVMVALGPATAANDAFEIELRAECKSVVAAETVRKQLEIQTRMLQIELAREHAESNPADLTGLLTAGRFDTSGKQVRGEWPVKRQLLAALK